jgi:hypothetical protein
MAGVRPGEMGWSAVFFAEKSVMNKRNKTKFIHEGRYVAEVSVELLDDEHGWAPYLSLEDAYKLDDVREALRAGDIQRAARYGQVYELRHLA